MIGKKTNITLRDGRIVDCGVEEFNEMKSAIQEKNPEKIASASIKVMLSSDKMIKGLVDEMKEITRNWRVEKEDS